MSRPELERVMTARMSGERMRNDHVEELARLELDPRVIPSLWPYPDDPTLKDVKCGVARMVRRWERDGFGWWFLRDRATGEMVGRGGLMLVDEPDVTGVEVGWAIVPDRWGQGLATELALASIEVAYGPLDLSEVVSMTLPDNLASRRVMEKSGFTFARDITHAGLPHVLYRRPRDAAAPRAS